MIAQFQSTLSVRRATGVLPGQLSIDDISIHALREESDTSDAEADLKKSQISIHALREESDCQRRIGLRLQRRFQSTLSVRRATCNYAVKSYVKFNFNPRSP